MTITKNTESSGEFCNLDEIGEIFELDWYVNNKDLLANIIEKLGLTDDDEFFPTDLTEEESQEFFYHGRNQMMHEKINALSIKVDFPKNILEIDIISNPFYHLLFQQARNKHLEKVDSEEKGIHKYFLVKLNPKEYDSRFLSLLAETPFYRRRWKGKIFNKDQQIIDINFIKKMDFFCPSIEIQKNVVSNILNLKMVNQQIDKYLQTASLNPFESIKDTIKIKEISKVVGSLPKPDLIKALIESGENDKVEFKSSFCHCIKNKTKEKYIIEEIIKTIAGFLNKDGGDLLVGVSDNGEIYGVEEELETHYKDSKDKFKQAFSQTINSSYTSSIDEFIEYEFYKFKDKSIFHVACKPSTKPIFANVKNKEIFYYRQNPQTIQLEGEKLVEYFSKRFPRN